MFARGVPQAVDQPLGLYIPAYICVLNQGYTGRQEPLQVVWGVCATDRPFFLPMPGFDLLRSPDTS